MKIAKIKYGIFFSMLIGLMACQKDEIGPQFTNENATALGIQNVFVLNEGNFNWGNASLSVYNPDTKTVSNRFFQATNDYALGDVAQSMAIRPNENRAYIVVNNSSKIEVVKLDDFTSEGVITGFNSPRYMTFSDENTAYVSDLYDNNLYKLNTETMEISKRIPAEGWTEDLWFYNDNLYVLNRAKSELWLLNTKSDSWEHKFNLGEGLVDMAVDDNNDIYLLLDPEEGTSSLLKFNTNRKTVEARYTFPNNIRPQHIRVYRNKLYYMANDVYSVATDRIELPGERIIEAGDRLFYNMEINPENGMLYISDAVDYVQNGWVYVYDESGSEKDRFQVNSIPGAIYFYNILAPF